MNSKPNLATSVGLFLGAFALVGSTAMAANTTTPSAGAKADNTAANKRDARGNTITPMDQLKGTSLDTEITRKIREQIVQDANFSVYAQNVKIITINKNVTLRGPVNNEIERSRIADIARNVAGPGGNVINELEIAR